MTIGKNFKPKNENEFVANRLKKVKPGKVASLVYSKLQYKLFIKLYNWLPGN